MAVIDMTAFAPESTGTPVVTVQPGPETATQPAETQAQNQSTSVDDITIVGVTPDEFALLESLYQSYLRFLKASREQAQAAKDLATAQTAFDACQGETKGAKEAFEVILKSLPDELVKIRDPQATVMIEAVRELQATSENLPECAREAISQTQAYEEWTKTSTQQIVDAGVPGLGKKKAELLVEKFPTIGDLEASRADAAESRVHWSKKLPKGFGVDVADAIYDAMAKLLRQIETAGSEINSESSSVQDEASDSTGSSEPSLAVDSEPEPPVVSDIDADDELEYEDFSDDDDELPFDEDGPVSNVSDSSESSDISALEWIESIYNEITENTTEQKKLWGLNQAGKNSPEWEKGRKAHEDGFEIGDCPYGKDREQAARDWLRGWIAASMNMDL